MTIATQDSSFIITISIATITKTRAHWSVSERIVSSINMAAGLKATTASKTLKVHSFLGGQYFLTASRRSPSETM